jgi:23S rRNA pseudouridine1911/1915/1917 synthase
METGQGQEASSTDPREIVSSWMQVGAAWAGLRADAFLFHELPVVSRTRIRQKVQTGEALLNGHRFSTSTRLRAGDRIRMTWRGTPVPDAGPDFQVLYEDEDLMVVNKPAGIATHPMGRRQAGTVVQFARRRLEARIRASLERGDRSFYPTVVNRLDVQTSGIVILALTRGVHKQMQAMAAARVVRREYLALVEGRIREDEGLIDLPIGFDLASPVRLKMACRPDGKESRTRYEVAERLPAHTLVRVFPQTGRQHQIRVHFAAIGHPVAGDLLYKDESRFLAEQEQTRSPAGTVGAPRPAARHGLHARRVGFTHPVTGAELSVEAEIPGDFAAMIAAARTARL